MKPLGRRWLWCLPPLLLLLSLGAEARIIPSSFPAIMVPSHADTDLPGGRPVSHPAARPGRAGQVGGQRGVPTTAKR